MTNVRSKKQPFPVVREENQRRIGKGNSLVIEVHSQLLAKHLGQLVFSLHPGDTDVN